jgi:3-hydroxyisobutyryl-CoA hydrolase
VEEIMQELESFVGSSDKVVSDWAQATLDALQLRSPTSLKVALEAIRRGKNMDLLGALQMEIKIATAYCVSNV